MDHTHATCPLLWWTKPCKSDYTRRLADFASRLAPNSAAVIVSNPDQTRSADTSFPYRQSSNILYLNGFPEPESVLIVTNFDGMPKLIMLVQPKDRAREIWTGIREGVEGAKKNYLADEAHPVSKFEEVLDKILSKAKQVYYKFGRNKRFDKQFRKVWARQQKPLANPEDIIHELRLCKQPEELALMRQAASVSAEAHCEAMRACRPGMTEFQLQAILEGTFTFHGADAPAYGSIVASGSNAIVLHYTRNRSRLKDGDLVLIDAACEYGGYAADITRTFPVNGSFTKPQREIYQVVLEAQLAGIAAAKPGVPLSKVHLAAQVALCQGLVRLGILPTSALVGPYLDKYGKGAYKGKKAKLHLLDLFMHGTSHWLGLDVHDAGDYKTSDGTRSDKGKGKQRILEPGMVITVEPGLYLDPADKRIPKKYRGIGIRIEDDVVITQDGNKVISYEVPKTVEDIELLMASAQMPPRRLIKPVRSPRHVVGLLPEEIPTAF